MSTLKTIFKVLTGILFALVLSVGIYAAVQVSAFNASMGKLYTVPSPTLQRSTDPAVLARGKHIAESTGGCVGSDCHGRDLSGGNPMDIGPLGTITGPNITPGGVVASYTDGELARVIRHGVKKDGHSLRFMPAQNFSWLSDADLTALVSYVRSVPARNKPNGEISIGVLAKVLDRRDQITIDIARRIDHDNPTYRGSAGATSEYGAFLARACRDCHGSHFSGGRIPGAPSSFAVPANLTPHESGLKDWSYEDFERLLATGVKKGGKKLDPFMPYQAFGKLDELEKRALWAYLRSLPPTPFGNR